MTPNSPPKVVIEFHLRQLMQERSVTTKQLSAATGLSRTSIWTMLEKFPRQIRFDTIAKLCVALDVLPGDLFVVRHPTVRT